MGALRNGINTLTTKWQIRNLSNESYAIIRELEKLDDSGKIIALEKLNLILSKINRLLSLEANKEYNRANNIINRSMAITNRAFQRLGSDNSPDFAEAVNRNNMR